jgi:hypothetical protein
LWRFVPLVRFTQASIYEGTSTQFLDINDASVVAAVETIPDHRQQNAVSLAARR